MPPNENGSEARNACRLLHIFLRCVMLIGASLCLCGEHFGWLNYDLCGVGGILICGSDISDCVVCRVRSAVRYGGAWCASPISRWPWDPCLLLLCARRVQSACVVSRGGKQIVNIKSKSWAVLPARLLGLTLIRAPLRLTRVPY